jgi:hypothetical protein
MICDSYPTMLAFLQDRPTQAIAVWNAPLLGYGTTEGAWYLQDDFVVSTASG